MEDIIIGNDGQLQFDILFEDTCAIIEQAQNKAIRAINVALTIRNWQIGQRIAREELDGAARAGYGEQVIQRLSEKLTSKFGKGYDRISLYNYIKFFRLFPEIIDAVSQQSQKVDAVSQQLLPWTHYRELIRVENREARQWYEQEALRETWSTRTLHRNIASQYYYLKCFLLIDLKTEAISHQDVGQMDMYVRMYDDLKRPKGDNPTIGLILCSDTSEDMARYSVLHDNARLFQAKYLTYLPSEEELKHEIEQQKEIFRLQQTDKNE